MKSRPQGYVDVSDAKLVAGDPEKVLTVYNSSAPDRQCVGSARIYFNENAVFISMIHVHASQRGKGYGKALLRAIVEQVRQLDLTTIVGDSNSSSLRGLMDSMLGSPVIHGDQNYLENETEGVYVAHTIPRQVQGTI